MRIEKQNSRIIITEYDEEERKKSILGVARFFQGGLMSDSLFNKTPDMIHEAVDDYDKLKKILKGEEFEFFFERDGKIIFPVGVINVIQEMFPKAKITETKSWPCDTLKYVTNPLPSPRNKLQQDAIRFMYANREYVAATLGAGTGKAEPYSRKIPTPNGWKLMGNLKIGDKVFSRDGNITNVTGIFEQGEIDTYKITFSDGRIAICNEEHLWNVKHRDDEEYKTKTLKEIMDNNYQENVYYIPNNKTVKYDDIDLEINPYLMGLLIGDNLLKEKFLKIRKTKFHIKSILLEVLPDEISIEEDDNFIYFKKDNELIQTKEFLKDYDFLIKLFEDNIYIPYEYTISSISDRRILIQGLINTIGEYHSYGQRSIITRSKKLLNQIQYILWSLGIKNEIINDRINFNFLYTPLGDDTACYIKNIEYNGKEKCRCIMVDNPEHLYLTEDFIVTHNTFMSTYTAMRLNKKALIVVPTTNLRRQWSESLQGLFKVPLDRIIEVTKKEDLLQDKDWYIILHQTVMNNNKLDEFEYVLKQSRIGTKIIDETHMFFKNVLMISCIANFENNIHLTATFGRSSEEEDKLFKKAFGEIPKFDYNKKNFLGEPVYPKKKHVHLYSININSKIPKKVLSSMSTSKYGLNVMKYSNLLFPTDSKELTLFEKDTLKVISNAVENVKYGKMLFLFPTIASSERMGKIIQKMFPDKLVRVLNSSHSKQENINTLQNADIIISTSKSSGTGLDIKGLSVVVAAEQYKSPILSEQMFGRLRERPDGKDTYYFDITDLASKQLVNWRNSRMAVMRPMAKSFQFDKGTNVKVISEEYDYLQYLYNESIEMNDINTSMKYLEEMMYYI